MKKIYNIPVYKNAERLGAFLEGNLSEKERQELELELQNDPEMAELTNDDIVVDWDDDINNDYPDFNWQDNNDLIELNLLSSHREVNKSGEFDKLDDQYDEKDDDNNLDKEIDEDNTGDYSSNETNDDEYDCDNSGDDFGDELVNDDYFSSY